MLKKYSNGQFFVDAGHCCLYVDQLVADNLHLPIDGNSVLLGYHVRCVSSSGGIMLTKNFGAGLISVYATVATLFFAVPVFSHHGWSGNTAGDVTITGVLVEKVQLRGPHGTMKIRDSEGQLWNVTLAPGPRTHRAGLKASVIPLGDVVTVHGARNDDLSEFEAKVRRVEWGENVFDVYPAK